MLDHWTDQNNNQNFIIPKKLKKIL